MVSGVKESFRMAGASPAVGIIEDYKKQNNGHGARHHGKDKKRLLD